MRTRIEVRPIDDDVNDVGLVFREPGRRVDFKELVPTIIGPVTYTKFPSEYIDPDIRNVDGLYSLVLLERQRGRRNTQRRFRIWHNDVDRYPIRIGSPRGKRRQHAVDRRYTAIALYCYKKRVDSARQTRAVDRNRDFRATGTGTELPEYLVNSDM